jgi:hypothetical protein
VSRGDLYRLRRLYAPGCKPWGESIPCHIERPDFGFSTDLLDLSAWFSVRRLSKSPFSEESSRTGPINANVEQGAGSDNTTFYASLINESYLGIYSKIRSEKVLFVKQAEFSVRSD